MNKYEITDRDGGNGKTIEATSLKAACELAEEWLIDGYMDSIGLDDETWWLSANVSLVDGNGDTDPYGDDTEIVEIALDPPEPKCSICDDGAKHNWQSPQFLGGLAENPGVRGHGGGVISEEVCIRCGCVRTTDTWAQNRSTGEQGLTSISYEIGKYFDEFYIIRVEEMREKATAIMEENGYMVCHDNDDDDVNTLLVKHLDSADSDRLLEILKSQNIGAIDKWDGDNDRSVWLDC